MPGPSLITGITGQDGSYLAEQLLAEGREVVGIVRPARGPAGLDGVTVVEADLLDPEGLRRAVLEAAPAEVFHLAAPAFVPDSWKRPAETVAAIATGTAAVLEAARAVGARALVAGSAQVFAGSGVSPQDEDTPPRPTTPYGAAKLAAHELARVLRADGAFVVTAIPYNHESPRRPAQYVTRKLTRAAAATSLGLSQRVPAGDLEARRDWIHAADVVRGMVLALRHDEPGEYVLAGGVARSVRDFARAAFAVVGLDADAHVEVDASLVRAPETTVLVGDASRAREVLGWEPRVSFEELVREMVEADLRELGPQK
jgi:GDPmannose 4,6-dehydratase